MNDYNRLAFTFNDFQNFKGDCQAEFYYRCATNDPAVYLVGGITGYPDYAYFGPTLNVDGFGPLVWTRKTFKLQAGIPFGVKADLCFARMKYIGLYVDSIAAPPVTIEIAGFTIRRL